MDIRDLLSGIGFGLAALVLAAFAWRAPSRSLLGLAVGCAALAASFLLAAHRWVSALLLIPALAGLVFAVVAESRRRRS